MSINPYYHWQHENSEETRIIGADSYAIEDGTPILESEERKGYKVFAKAIVNGRVPPPENLPVKWADKETIEVFAFGDWASPIWAFEFYYDSSNCWFDITWTDAPGGNANGGFCTKKTSRVRAFTKDPDSGSSRSVKVNPGSYNDPAIDLGKGFFDYSIKENPNFFPKACLTEVPTTCILKFFKEGATVLEIEKPKCPEVWEKYPECPAETCEIDCGNHVCCVDARGYVVDGYTKR